MSTTEPIRYIGDAVYAVFDGYGISLRLDNHRAPDVVYLEPPVVAALATFAAQHGILQAPEAQP